MRTTKIALALVVGATGALLAAPSSASAAPSHTAAVSRCYVGRPVPPAYLRFLYRLRPVQQCPAYHTQATAWR